MKSFLKTLLLASSATAADKYNYKTNGADWGTIEDSVIAGNICGTGKNQSPIDLKTKGWTMKHSDFDNFNKIYTNQEVDVKVNWNGHTSQVDLTNEGQTTQTISSKHSADGHGSSGTTYNGV